MLDELSAPKPELELRVNVLARSIFSGFVLLVIGQLPVAMGAGTISAYVYALPGHTFIAWTSWALLQLGLLGLIVFRIWRPALLASRAPQSAPPGDPNWSKYDEKRGAGLILGTGAAVGIFVHWMGEGDYQKAATTIALEVFVAAAMLFLASFLGARFYLQRRIGVLAVAGLGLLSWALFSLYRL